MLLIKFEKISCLEVMSLAIIASTFFLMRSEVSLSIFNTEKRSNGVSFISSPAIKSEYNNSIMNAFSYTNHNISAKRQLVFNTTNEAIANKSDNIKILPYLLQGNLIYIL